MFKLWRQATLGFVPIVFFCGLLSAPLKAQTSANTYRQLGLDYRQQGRLSEAIAAFESATNQEPGNVSGLVLLGWTQHLAGQETEAAQTLLDAVYTDPFSVPALNALGIVYLVSGDLVSAIAVHEWATVLAPDNEIPYFNLSLAYERLDWYKRAEVQAERAAILEPDNPHPFVARAIAQWGEKNFTGAQKTYQQAMILDGRYGDRLFLSHLEQAAFSAEQINKTEQVFDSLLK